MAARSEPPCEQVRRIAMSPRRSREKQPLRYYLYISDAKLDMLFEQIDRSVLKRISAEIKIDLKVASLTLREADSPAPTRAAKLRIVEHFIDTNHNVGTISEPGGEFFRGQMNMQWGDMTYSAAVCFKGVDSQGSDGVLLVGSRHHVIGETPPPVRVSYSSFPRVTSTLMDLVNHSESEDVGSAEREDFDQGAFLHMVWQSLSRQGAFHGLPTQHLHFLAVPLAEYGYKGEYQLHIVLGTPLYIAMAR